LYPFFISVHTKPSIPPPRSNGHFLPSPAPKKNTPPPPPAKFPAQSTHFDGTGRTNSPPPANTPPQTESSSTDAPATETQLPNPVSSSACAKRKASARSNQRTVHPPIPRTPGSRRSARPEQPSPSANSPAVLPQRDPASAHLPAPLPRETPGPRPLQKTRADRSVRTGLKIPASKSRCPRPETPRLCSPEPAALRPTPASTFP